MDAYREIERDPEHLLRKVKAHGGVKSAEAIMHIAIDAAAVLRRQWRVGDARWLEHFAQKTWARVRAKRNRIKQQLVSNLTKDRSPVDRVPLPTFARSKGQEKGNDDSRW